MSTSILKLAPACKNYIWGGRRLIEDFNINFDGKTLAEAWVLAAHKDGASIITNGDYAGKNFCEYLGEVGSGVLGENCRNFKDFPILIKFIDAQDNLSIQVHPSDDYALKVEGQLGKHEMWYILDAAPNSFIYHGLNRTVSKKEFAERIKAGTLTEILRKVYVKRGDCIFIPAGTIHSVGAGVLLAEIQQNSNVSYRIFDYGRVDANGKTRQLHIDKAVDVANLSPIEQDEKKYPHLVTCDYFTVDKINLDGKFFSRLEGTVTAESFLSILILDGQGKISVDEEELNFQRGDSFFIPANSRKWAITGFVDALATTVRLGR